MRRQSAWPTCLSTCCTPRSIPESATKRSDMATAPGVATPEEYVGDTLAREQTSLWADAWRRLKRNRLALGSAVFLVLLLVVAIISVFWTPYPLWRQGVAHTYQDPDSDLRL